MDRTGNGNNEIIYTFSNVMYRNTHLPNMLLNILFGAAMLLLIPGDVIRMWIEHPEMRYEDWWLVLLPCVLYGGGGIMSIVRYRRKRAEVKESEVRVMRKDGKTVLAALLYADKEAAIYRVDYVDSWKHRYSGIDVYGDVWKEIRAEDGELIEKKLDAKLSIPAYFEGMGDIADVLGEIEHASDLQAG